ERRYVRGIDLVTVHCEVAHLHVLVAHAQGHDQADELEEHERPHPGEADHPGSRERLPFQEVQAARDGDARNDLHRRAGEEAGAGFVFRTADAASAPALDGSAPLKPSQPIQRRPAPTATMARLFGASTSRSRARRGPITHAAMKPETPAERWIT